VFYKAMPDDTIATRPSLLERLKDLGDTRSWNDFYQTYRDLLYSVACRAGLNETEADEAVQETLISVAKKMPGFRYDPATDSFKGWLLTVTRWRIRDQLAKRNQGLVISAASGEKTGTRTKTIEQFPDPAGVDLASIWDEEWHKHVLQTALARIKRQVHPQHYEIYHLHVLLGKPVREVTRTLGVSAGQVYLARHRISRLLKKEIRKLESMKA
jgi:RNA polymerase sigma-70 factor (ECF subfamily)